jgi:thiol-disulfide isomerase/thioredoxin
MTGPALLLCGLALAAPAARPLIGDPAPAFELPALDGAPVTRAQLSGKVTVVEFFATWCLPCARSLEDLRQIRAELGPDFQVLIIAVEADRAKLRTHLQRNPPPAGALVVVDAADVSRRLWGRDRFPTSFFVDRVGTIRHINRGHGPGFRARATRWLRGLQAGDGAVP